MQKNMAKVQSKLGLLLVASLAFCVAVASAIPTDSIEFADDRLSKADVDFYKSRTPKSWEAESQDTLKQVLFIHRHGDRTPIVFPSKDNLATEPFWTFHGLSQLTNRGKARLHMLGSIIRQRYNKFLGGLVNKNSRKTRSSGSLRCIESAQMFLSAFLGLDVPASPDARALAWDRARSNRLSAIWQPASVNTLAAKWDGMLNEGAACKRLDAEMDAIDASDEFKQLHEEFAHEARVLKEELNNQVDHFYEWFWAASLLEVELSYFKRKVKPNLREIFARVDEAGDRALMMLQKSTNMRRFRIGLLVNDMIENMEAMRRDDKINPFVKKFVHYSAHDVTLIFLMGVLEQIGGKRPVRPDYAGNIMVELHQDPSTGDEWFLKFFYMQHVPSEPEELHIVACEQESGRCTLEKFAEMMNKYRVAGWADWMRECDNSFDDVNPYSDNY